MEIINLYQARDMLDKIKTIFEVSLITQKKVREFIANLSVLYAFEQSMFFQLDPEDRLLIEENKRKEIEEEQNLTKFETKEEKEQKNLQAENMDRFFTFLPFWDTQFCLGSNDDAVFLRARLEISVPDSYNISQVLKCETLREIVVHYQNNRESQNIGAFTQEEVGWCLTKDTEA
jgi:hypothetical protein